MTDAFVGEQVTIGIQGWEYSGQCADRGGHRDEKRMEEICQCKYGTEHRSEIMGNGAGGTRGSIPASRTC